MTELCVHNEGICSMVDPFITTNERCLTFKYAGNDKVENAINLSSLLDQNKIDHVCYLETGNYYPCQFILRRSGRKWNDIMKLVNSVQSPKYDYAKIDFYITDEVKKNVLGKIQVIQYC